MIKVIQILTPGQLVMVVGPVASGKSSILMALLGEIPIVKAATLDIHGSLAYVGQQPWIFSDTVRENIVFGRNFDKDRYDQVCLPFSFAYETVVMVRDKERKNERN